MLLENWLQRSRCWNVTWHFDIIWKASEVQVFQEVSWHSFLQDHVQSHLPLSALTRPICQMLRANCVVCGAGSFQAHSTGRTETTCAKKQNPLLISVKHMMVFFDFAVEYTKWKCVFPLTIFMVRVCRYKLIIFPLWQIWCIAYYHYFTRICAQMSYHIISNSHFKSKTLRYPVGAAIMF